MNSSAMCRKSCSELFTGVAVSRKTSFLPRGPHQVEQLPVTGRRPAILARAARIAEMVCLVDDDDIRQFLDAPEVVG